MTHRARGLQATISKGAAILDPPEMKRRAPRRRVHERDGVTTQRTANAAQGVEEKR